MPKKILTIDDDPYIVKYITEVLSDTGEWRADYQRW